MPWADTVFQDLDNWVDCIWQDWDDCEWDKFSIVYQDAKTRTMRQLPPEGASNFRRPYLEGNPSYVEDNLKYPDVAVENARINVKDEVRPHMTMKQPYRYKQFQKMKYRDEPVNDKLVETPGDIMAGEVPKEYEWQWVRYFDNKRWTPSIGEWFDNRWIEGVGGTTWVAHFDDSNWEPDNVDLEWVNERWEGSGSSDFDLNPIGAWVTGYRPNKIRITFDENLTSATETKLYIEDQPGYIVNGETIYVKETAGAPTEVTMTFGDYDIQCLYWDMDLEDWVVTNIEFEETVAIDLSVVPGSWWKDLRPKKFRMKFDNATADVSLQDKNGTEIYANATYASGTEVDLAFAGADIDRLVVSGSGDVADIELFHQVEKGLYLDSNQKSPRKETVGKPQRFPDPNPIRPSERIARRTNLRPIR